MNTTAPSAGDAIGHRASIRAARFNAASDTDSDESSAYADLDDDALASGITEMENVIDGMAKMHMGTAHESRILAEMKKEQDRRAA